MASEGPLFPGTVTEADEEAGLSLAWVNEGNVAADDGTEAQITAAQFDTNVSSFRIHATNYGFSIPSDATIDGIVVEVERRDFAGSGSDLTVQLQDDAGSPVGNNKAILNTSWPGTPTIQSYGSSSDTWGWATVTPTKINDADFGVLFGAVALANNTDIGVDFIRVTVHYTPAGGTTTAFAVVAGV